MGLVFLTVLSLSRAKYTLLKCFNSLNFVIWSAWQAFFKGLPPPAFLFVFPILMDSWRFASRVVLTSRILFTLSNSFFKGVIYGLLFDSLIDWIVFTPYRQYFSHLTAVVEHAPWSTRGRSSKLLKDNFIYLPKNKYPSPDINMHFKVKNN